jgi:tRNA dimethylallyltransferase
MIEKGLVEEINALRDIESSQTLSTAQTAVSTQSEDSMTEYTNGLYQSIGYKEFNEYLASPQRSEEAFNDAVSYMKQTTRKYAKGQVSWLRNKLLPAVHAANVESQKTGLITPTYLLDATGDFS